MVSVSKREQEAKEVVVSASPRKRVDVPPTSKCKAPPRGYPMQWSKEEFVM